jgi:hypothetical protein
MQRPRFFIFFWGSTIRQNIADLPNWALPVLAVLGIFNVVCAVALFQWKKWALWGFVASAVIAFAINLRIGLGVGQSVLGLVSIAVLYWVLQVGGEKKGWAQLE